MNERGHKRKVKKDREVLTHARRITERQLQEALEKQKRTGKKLWEILMSDLSLRSVKELLTYEIRGKGKKKKLKEVMIESGFTTEQELEEAVANEEGTGLRLGDALVQRGLITREQLKRALIEQERTGYPLGRVLMNMGLVNAKQISDALRLKAPSVAAKNRRKQIMEGVLKNGLIPREQMEEALKESEETGRDLGEIIVEKGLLSAQQLGEILEKELGVPYISLTGYKIDPEIVDLIPESLIRQRRVLPLRKEEGRLVVAMAAPDDISTIDDLGMITGYEIEPVLVWNKQLEATINKLYGKKVAVTEAPEKVEKVEAPGGVVAEVKEKEERLEELVESVSVVNLVSSIVEGAIHSEATDIHLEPQANDMRVRYRIDGMLYDIMAIPKAIEPGLISRIKILANMDITERRLPQDGHFSLNIKGKAYDMRIATLPTSLGESVVIRLLNPSNVFMGLKKLGLSESDYSKVDTLIHKPNGMFLVTGPIGSGKTTTLYAALQQINVFSDSIVTIEDPIEYELPGINQVQVDYKVNRTFATTLRAVLRQDVDTFLVGEIRDVETAQIAVRAAITGHLLFTTLHTKDAVSAITTLLHLDIPRFLVASSVIGIVNQRLVRKICPHCAEEYEPKEVLIKELGLEGKLEAGTKFARGMGCSYCYHTGYHGRTGIFEVLVMSDRINDLILKNATEKEIHKAAISEGMTTLFDDALKKVKERITSVEELIRTVYI